MKRFFEKFLGGICRNFSHSLPSPRHTEDEQYTGQATQPEAVETAQQGKAKGSQGMSKGVDDGDGRQHAAQKGAKGQVKEGFTWPVLPGARRQVS